MSGYCKFTYFAFNLGSLYIYIIHSDLLYYSLKASDDEFWKEQGDMIQIVKPLWKKQC